MSTFYKFYINSTEFTPTNRGGITIDYTRERESGSYQYVKTLSSPIIFGNDDGAYNYISKHSDIQDIYLVIKEFCAEFRDGIDIFNGRFNIRNSSIDPLTGIIEITPEEDSYYQNVLKNYDRNFNILESPTVVSSTYAEDISSIEYQTRGLAAFLIDIPFYDLMWDSGPLFIGLAVYARETITTYCQGGQKQSPKNGPYSPWKLLYDNCEGKGLSTWYRLPAALRPALMPSLNTSVTLCTGLGCIPPTPPIFLGNEVWLLLNTSLTTNPVGAVSFWLDTNSMEKNDQKINNGRLLTEVVNDALNQHEDTKDLDLQSNILNNIVNPVNGSSPSTLYQAQLHSIDDVKDPSATESAPVEKTTLKELLDGLIYSKYNCFWRVVEGTRRFVIEHISDRNNSNVIDLRDIDDGFWLKGKGKYSYDNTDIPRAEEFPSSDVSIDFTGIDIDYDNDFSSGKKAFITDKFYSEVSEIISSPDNYPSDGIVVITPDSLAPDGTLDEDDFPIGLRSENGAITGDYRPNAPQAMANLQNEFYPYNRPFDSGVMNFAPRAFEDERKVKLLEPINVPICCLFLFSPESSFIGNTFDSADLISSSYSLATGIMTLNLEY